MDVYVAKCSSCLLLLGTLSVVVVVAISTTIYTATMKNIITHAIVAVTPDGMPKLWFQALQLLHETGCRGLCHLVGFSVEH